MDLTHHVLERPGASLHYWLGGVTNRPFVFLTHGATVDHREWGATAAVVGERYRIVTWDMRAHGASRPARFTVADSVDDLLALLETVGGPQAAFVGHSLGGNVHQELVFRHPDRVAAMACVDSAWNFQRLTWLEALTVRAARPIFMLYPHKLLVAQALSAASESKAAQDVLRPAMTSLTKDEFVDISVAMTECLHYEPGYTVNKPLLLILGDKDATGNIRKTMPMWARIEPDCKLVVVPGVRHSPNLDAPEVFHQELMRFLQARFP
jgi:pimeloyl-ACP methyl ester carboxylesterase